MVFTQTTTQFSTSENQELISLNREALMKRLVRNVENVAPLQVLQQTEQTVDEVIFDIDIDGIHYYLVRCRPRTESKISQISLSPRERAIAKLVAQGFPNKRIGSHLDISPWTVATHLRRIFAKLEVNSRTAMITRILEENLLQD